MLLLGIETSCDETAAAVLRGENEILSSEVASQLGTHAEFGGVVPELAARRHLELINPVIDRALSAAGISFAELEGVAATYGPGLVGSILIGLSAAKSIALARGIPLVGVNHMEGHIAASFLAHEDLHCPLVALTVSGGHTDLLYLPARENFEFLGRTRDDAAGEAFDKVARILGLEYPGGPAIDRLARAGDEEAVDFPRAYLKGGFDFSFSGLKTAVKNFWTRYPEGEGPARADVAASFQKAVVDVLVDKLFAAAREKRVERVLVSGGVACNSRLRRELFNRCEQEGVRVYIPPPELCTDNAAMIVGAARDKFARGEFAPLSLDVYPNLKLGEKKY